MVIRRMRVSLAVCLGVTLLAAGCGVDPALTETGSDVTAGNSAAADPLLTKNPDMKKQLKSVKAAGAASGIPAGMPGMGGPPPPAR